MTSIMIKTVTSVVWKWTFRVVIQWSVGTVGGIISGILGLIFGSIIGAGWFPGFGGVQAGYEAGGVFFGLLGIALGSFAWIIIVQMLLHEPYSYWVALFGFSVSFVVDLVLYDYNAPRSTLILILVLPPSLAVVGFQLWRIRAFLAGREAGPTGQPSEVD